MEAPGTDGQKKEYHLEMTPEETTLLIYKTGHNLHNIQPGDGVLLLRKHITLMLGKSVPMADNFGEREVLQMADQSLYEGGSAQDFSMLPMMKFNEQKLQTRELEDMLVNNKKILDILRYELGDSQEDFFNFSDGELTFSDFDDMNNSYLKELGDIVENQVLPVYLGMVHDQHLIDPLKGGFSHESESSLTKKIKAVISDFKAKLLQNIFMISPIRQFYENDLKKSLNIENMQKALVGKISNNHENLLAGAVDHLIQNRMDELEFSLENPWQGKPNKEKFVYVMEIMLENIYSHISSVIGEILLEEIHSKELDREEVALHAIEHLDKNLTHLISHLNAKMQEQVKLGWPGLTMDFDAEIIPKFLESANIGKFFVKESLDSKLEDLREFVKNYVNQTIERTFFTNMMDGKIVNKDKFRAYMQMIDTRYANDLSVLAPLLDNSGMRRELADQPGKKRLVLL